MKNAAAVALWLCSTFVPLSHSLYVSFSFSFSLSLSLSLSHSVCSFLLPSAFGEPSQPSTKVFQKHTVRHAVHLHRVRHRCWSVPSSVLQWLRLQELVRSLGEPCIMKSCETCPALNEFVRPSSHFAPGCFSIVLRGRCTIF